MTNRDFRKTNIDTMLQHLKMSLSYCNIYQDIKKLSYDPEHEVVICEYYGATAADRTRPVWTLEINVACDSNSAIIMDVIKRLDAFFG